MKDINLPEQSGKAPFFYCTKDRMIQRPAYTSLTSINDPEIDFISSIIDKCCSQESGLIDSSVLRLSLKEKGSSNSLPLVQKRVRKLLKLGFIKNIDYKREGKRTCSCYVLQDPKEVQENKEIYEDHRPNKKNLFNLKASLQSDDELLSLTDLNTNKIKSESLFTGLLDRSLRINTSDTRQTITEHAEIRVKDKAFPGKTKDFIRIKSNCNSDGDLMLLSDQRYVRAILSIASQMIEEDINKNSFKYEIGEKKTKNNFLIDIVDVCEIIKTSSAGSGRTSVRNAIERIRNTEWLIEADPDGWFVKSYMQGFDGFYFRLFSDFAVASEKEGNKFRKPRFYRVSFNEYTFACLKDKDYRRMFVSNPEICSQNSGIIQSLYSYCRMAIGGGNNVKGNRPISRRLKDFNADIFPSFGNYHIFERDFMKHLSPFSSGGRGEFKAKSKDQYKKAKVLGYYISVFWKEEDQNYWIELSRDKKDEYVGDNSVHNNLNNKQIIEQIPLLQ